MTNIRKNIKINLFDIYILLNRNIENVEKYQNDVFEMSYQINNLLKIIEQLIIHVDKMVTELPDKYIEE